MYEKLLSIPPYALNKDEKEKLLTERLTELTRPVSYTHLTLPTT